MFQSQTRLKAVVARIALFFMVISTFVAPLKVAKAAGNGIVTGYVCIDQDNSQSCTAGDIFVENIGLSFVDVDNQPPALPYGTGSSQNGAYSYGLNESGSSTTSIADPQQVVSFALSQGVTLNPVALGGNQFQTDTYPTFHDFVFVPQVVGGPISTTGVVNGFVFDDVDTDGFWDANEQGIEQMKIDLVEDISGVLHTVFTGPTVFDANGIPSNFSISNVATGTGFVNVDPSSVPLTDSQSPYYQHVPTNQIFQTFNLTPDQVFAAAPFGFGVTPPGGNQNCLVVACTGQITGHVFFDFDANGSQAGNDPDVDGITITLMQPDPDANGNLVPVQGVDPVVTDAQGNYAFNDIPVGQYKVDINQNDPAHLPVGSFLSTNKPNLGGYDPQDVDLNTSLKAANPVGYTLDASRAQVHGHLFVDDSGVLGTIDQATDSDGIHQDEVESSLPNVNVTVEDISGFPQVVQTDANGDYAVFVYAGSVDVKIDVTDLDDPATPNVYEGIPVGSDITTLGNTPAGTVNQTLIAQAGQLNPAAPVGFGPRPPVPTGRVQILVCQDPGQDGCSVGDAGIPGATVTVTDTQDSSNTFSGVTDAAGLVSTGIMSFADYTVTVDDSTVNPSFFHTVPATNVQSVSLNAQTPGQSVSFGYDVAPDPCAGPIVSPGCNPPGLEPTTLRGFMYFDARMFHNEVSAGEEGIEGALLHVTQDGGFAVNVTTGATKTGANGELYNYEITGLTPGVPAHVALDMTNSPTFQDQANPWAHAPKVTTYFEKTPLPLDPNDPNYAANYAAHYTQDADEAFTDQQDVTISGNVANYAANIGVDAPIKIEGEIFNDLNGNGIQEYDDVNKNGRYDKGEPGLPNIPVEPGIEGVEVVRGNFSGAGHAYIGMYPSTMVVLTTDENGHYEQLLDISTFKEGFWGAVRDGKNNIINPSYVAPNNVPDANYPAWQAILNPAGSPLDGWEMTTVMKDTGAIDAPFQSQIGLASGPSGTTIEFNDVGYRLPPPPEPTTLRGFVFFDARALHNQYNPALGEVGIADALVRVTQKDGAGNVVFDQKVQTGGTQDANGTPYNYEISGLTPGLPATVELLMDSPAFTSGNNPWSKDAEVVTFNDVNNDGYWDLIDPPNVNVMESLNNPQELNVVGNTTNYAAMLGVDSPITLQGEIFNDLNGNGKQEYDDLNGNGWYDKGEPGEPGIEGIQVVRGAYAGANNAYVGIYPSTMVVLTTDENGRYKQVISPTTFKESFWGAVRDGKNNIVNPNYVDPYNVPDANYPAWQAILNPAGSPLDGWTRTTLIQNTGADNQPLEVQIGKATGSSGKELRLNDVGYQLPGDPGDPGDPSDPSDPGNSGPGGSDISNNPVIVVVQNQGPTPDQGGVTPPPVSVYTGGGTTPNNPGTTVPGGTVVPGGTPNPEVPGVFVGGGAEQNPPSSNDQGEVLPATGGSSDQLLQMLFGLFLIFIAVGVTRRKTEKAE